MSLGDTLTELHDEARTRENAGHREAGFLLRCAADLVAEARNVDRREHWDEVPVDQKNAGREWMVGSA